METGNETLALRRAVRIGVGYGWAEGGVWADARWIALRDFLTKVAHDAGKRASRMIARHSSVEDEDADVASEDLGLESQIEIPQTTIGRLRATAGQFTWSSVTQHIMECDLLVFDLTPTKKVEGSNELQTSANLWLELGFALATKKPTFVVHAHEDGYKALPSDLRGMIVGGLPADGRAVDASLRMALVQALRRLLVERATLRFAGAVAGAL